ncbi:MAG: flagellar biosynthetic protein FliP [Candidatus Margulisiibacteriota bacterium]|nr:MAG: flagellar biosynthetic protein FliP [Candidatus Margulisiibacteriota bacterium]HAR62227.1 flagellar biosynthetic protein FliP [Candidatus Margulisiibacteriota bacterium]HCT84018.1 flagellar biosynthetic protein FliP [Candidatus Margulisiibacteriota bacterium]HCY36169.1 flagellar biosynthetic protein FliP [Candidatus Margulisiibacteriota bacterium]
MKLLFFIFTFLLAGSAVYAAVAHPAVAEPISFSLDTIKKPLVFSDSISLLIALSSISLIPFFLITTTSFLRIIIVLGSLRMALGTQQSPPNSVLIAVALFLTVFIMSGVWGQIEKTALVPYNKGKISQEQAINNAITPLKSFMLRQVKESDLALLIQISKIKVAKPDDVPIWVVIPAFIMSEITIGFSIAFVIFIPFVLVDLIVANVLLSLGMFMLSPVMISLPFKILLFVLADGFALITKGLLLSFH